MRNREIIQKELDRVGGRPTRDWFEKLKIDWLELNESISWTAFTKYWTVLQAVVEELELLDKERVAAARKFEGPKRIRGWSIQLSGGYYRAHRKMEGKLRSVHIGKTLDVKKATKKIKAKEQEFKSRDMKGGRK